MTFLTSKKKICRKKYATSQKITQVLCFFYTVQITYISIFHLPMLLLLVANISSFLYFDFIIHVPNYYIAITINW